ncbi:MAG: hypothetical protein Q4P28_05710 [Tissierellia bacterium]|nr:hypothetical protein [Tissierellia bacterium]
MSFQFPYFKTPDFSKEKYKNFPDVQTKICEKDGVCPGNFYMTSHRPIYYKINGEFHLPEISSLNCCCVIKDNEAIITELHDVKKGDLVVQGDLEDGSQGIYTYPDGDPDLYKKHPSRVESSFTEKYRLLYDLMEYEKNNGGKIIWVMGPSVIFDYDSRNILSSLAKEGYIHGLLGGNAVATHDLEGGYLNTALGQNIYTQESVPLGHYHHLDLLNEVRREGSISSFIEKGHVKNGLMKILDEKNIPFALAGSVRDDGPLPEVHGNIYDSIAETKEITKDAGLILCLATILHSVSTANLASSYRKEKDGKVRPVFLYTVDIHENIVHKVADSREGFATYTMVTNVQDFLTNIHHELIGPLDPPDPSFFDKEVKS